MLLKHLNNCTRRHVALCLWQYCSSLVKARDNPVSEKYLPPCEPNPIIQKVKNFGLNRHTIFIIIISRFAVFINLSVTFMYTTFTCGALYSNFTVIQLPNSMRTY